MKFYQEKHINNLPDCYNKDEESNNYKLLELSSYNVDGFRHALKQIDDILNINNAKGATLDLYGQIVGQKRGLATDEQYLVMIKTRIMRNLANGSYKSITDAICAILNCKKEQVFFEELDTPYKVKMSSIPLSAIFAAGLTTRQFTQIIKSLMPVGVSFESGGINYEGTFEFSDVADEYDETAGFGDVNNELIGGYLGSSSEAPDDIILPI